MDEDRIKNELVQRRIKLWRPPYYGVQGSLDSLRALAGEFSNNSTTADGIQVVTTLLKSIQQHALDKLRTKGKLLEELHIKILGAPPSLIRLVDGEYITHDFAKSWAEQVKVSTLPSNGRNTSAILLLQLFHVNLDLQIGDFVDHLSTLSASDGLMFSIRLIYGGKTLPQGSRFSQELTGKAKLMCLIQANTSQTATITTVSSSSDEEMIRNIRTAATKIQNDAALEITDGTGNLVSMSKTDRLSFLTALGLHAIGRQRMQRDEFESALLFLLQADQEWNLLDKSWRDRVDNFGLLQLDICWVYLKLESMDSLPDVQRRLEQAEISLRKQVHTNFVTLALVQAEMNNPVPAVATIFVRLFLLQGVAFFHQQMKLKSQERLDWAWAFASSLRNMSPAESISRLCEAVNISPTEARVALRKSGGNLDAAADSIEKDWLDKQLSLDRRLKQQKFGLCANGRDFVDLERLTTLKSLLGSETDEIVAAGLLRINNNNLELSIASYQSGGNFDVMQKVAELDQRQGVSRKRSRVVVDDLALASLVSCGVDNDTASNALQSCNNNVDLALLWLTRDDQLSAAVNDSTGDQAIQNRNEINDLQGSSVASNPLISSELAQREAEQDAMDLLKEALSEVLEQNQSDDYLGASLDDEWNYILQYRQEH